MIREYTLTEMEGIWRRRLGLLDDDCGCVVTRHDGTSLNALIADRIRSWYAELMHKAEIQLLPIRDVTDEIQTIHLISGNCIEIELPVKGLRVISVKLDDWAEPLDVISSNDSDAAALQHNRFLRATPRRPVAIVSGHTLRLYGLSNESKENVTESNLRSRLTRLTMVAYPETSDTYILDTSLLDTIPNTI